MRGPLLRTELDPSRVLPGVIVAVGWCPEPQLDSVLDTGPRNVEATSGFEPLNRGFADLANTCSTRPSVCFPLSLRRV